MLRSTIFSLRSAYRASNALKFKPFIMPTSFQMIAPIQFFSTSQNSRQEQSSESSDGENEQPQRRGQDRGERDFQRRDYNKNPVRRSRHEAFVRNYPFTATEDAIRDFFSDCGEIESITFLRLPDGRSRGTAFVRFHDEESLQNAINLSNSDFSGRKIIIEKSKTREEKEEERHQAPSSPYRMRDQTPNNSVKPDDGNSVYVGNLSYNTSEESLQEAFSKYGNIKSVKIKRDMAGKSKGFGYITFDDANTAQDIIGTEGFNVDGRNLKIAAVVRRTNEDNNYRRGGGFRSNQDDKDLE